MGIILWEICLMKHKDGMKENSIHYSCSILFLYICTLWMCAHRAQISNWVLCHFLKTQANDKLSWWFNTGPIRTRLSPEHRIILIHSFQSCDWCKDLAVKTSIELQQRPVNQIDVKSQSTNTPSHYVKAWLALLGILEWVLNTVTNGYMLQFACRPPHFNSVVMCGSSSECTSLKGRNSQPLHKASHRGSASHGVQNKVFSHYFLVPKKDVKTTEVHCQNDQIQKDYIEAYPLRPST